MAPAAFYQSWRLSPFYNLISPSSNHVPRAPRADLDPIAPISQKPPTTSKPANTKAIHEALSGSHKLVPNVSTFDLSAQRSTLRQSVAADRSRAVTTLEARNPLPTLTFRPEFPKAELLPASAEGNAPPSTASHPKSSLYFPKITSTTPSSISTSEPLPSSSPPPSGVGFSTTSIKEKNTHGTETSLGPKTQAPAIVSWPANTNTGLSTPDIVITSSSGIGSTEVQVPSDTLSTLTSQSLSVSAVLLASSSAIASGPPETLSSPSSITSGVSDVGPRMSTTRRRRPLQFAKAMTTGSIIEVVPTPAAAVSFARPETSTKSRGRPLHALRPTVTTPPAKTSFGGPLLPLPVLPTGPILPLFSLASLVFTPSTARPPKGTLPPGKDSPREPTSTEAPTAATSERPRLLPAFTFLPLPESPKPDSTTPASTSTVGNGAGLSTESSRPTSRAGNAGQVSRPMPASTAVPPMPSPSDATTVATTAGSAPRPILTGTRGEAATTTLQSLSTAVTQAQGSEESGPGNPKTTTSFIQIPQLPSSSVSSGTKLSATTALGDEVPVSVTTFVTATVPVTTLRETTRDGKLTSVSVVETRTTIIPSVIPNPTASLAPIGAAKGSTRNQAAVGAAIGGAILVFAGVLLTLYLLNRRRRQSLKFQDDIFERYSSPSPTRVASRLSLRGDKVQSPNDGPPASNDHPMDDHNSPQLPPSIFISGGSPPPIFGLPTRPLARAPLVGLQTPAFPAPLLGTALAQDGQSTLAVPRGAFVDPKSSPDVNGDSVHRTEPLTFGEGTPLSDRGSEPQGGRKRSSAASAASRDVEVGYAV